MSKEKNKKKSRIFDIILFGVAALIIFTPVGKPVKLWASKLMSLMAPSVKKEENREVLNNYEWKLMDYEGNTYNMEEAKGKVVFVNHWATWCPPCIAEMPSIQKLYDKYKNNPDINFIFATTDPKEDIDKFMTKNNYNLPVYFMHSTAPPQLSSATIPMTSLIGKDGSIAIRKKGSANWNSKGVHKTIDKLLKE